MSEELSLPLSDEPHISDELPITDEMLVADTAPSTTVLFPPTARSSASLVGVPASISVPLGPGGPSAVRRHVTGVLDSNGVDEAVCADVELLVSELVSNVIRHEDATTVRVDIVVAANLAVTATVAGEGHALPADALVYPPGMSALTSETGRGLAVLDALATAWGTRRQNHHTAVWFIVGEPASDAGFTGVANAGYTVTDERLGVDVGVDVSEMSLSLPDVEGVTSTVRLVTEPDAGVVQVVEQAVEQAVEHAVETAVQTAVRQASITSARLHEADLELQRVAGRHDRHVAVALQQAMLTRLPECRGLELAARYLTAAEYDQVGGDWYDALVLPNGCTVLVIGDVIGHDIAAAALMGQLRNLLRALVWDRDESPSQLVSRLDRAIRDLRVDTIATLILVMVNPPSAESVGGAAGRTIRWTNAGHPALVLVSSDGTASMLEATSDLVLGVDAARPRRDFTAVVPPGATLLLYTDGLIETAAQDIEAGQSLLLDAMQGRQLDEPGALLDEVLADLVGHRPADDVAVLAVRFVEQ